MLPKCCAILAVVIGATLLDGCSKEARTLAPEQPQTPPHGADDPRAALFDGNALQVSQGGRYFTWYGCGACHAGGARGPLDLADDRWTHGKAVDQVYASIADRHARNYRQLIPTQQLWQLTAYVRSLPTLDPALRRREDADARGEPSANSWGGALR
jgi:cytochrome c oxidase cbb3-type subunit 3